MRDDTSPDGGQRTPGQKRRLTRPLPGRRVCATCPGVGQTRPGCSFTTPLRPAPSARAHRARSHGPMNEKLMFVPKNQPLHTTRGSTTRHHLTLGRLTLPKVMYITLSSVNVLFVCLHGRLGGQVKSSGSAPASGAQIRRMRIDFLYVVVNFHTCDLK